MQPESRQLKQVQKADPQRVCIFLGQPFADCYCMNISSFNIGKMLSFCTGDYRSCPIYLQKTAETQAAACDCAG